MFIIVFVDNNNSNVVQCCLVPSALQNINLQPVNHLSSPLPMIPADRLSSVLPIGTFCGKVYFLCSFEIEELEFDVQY